MYSSPSAYLNRFFKKQNRFVYSDDLYTNPDFQLVWIEGEQFVLQVHVMDVDTGADFYDDHSTGELTELVQKIREFYKNGVLGK